VSKRAVTEADVLAAAGSTRTIVLAKDAVVTPAARDLAKKLGVVLSAEKGRPETEKTSTSRSSSPNIDAVSVSGRPLIALGADHGGFPMKEALKKSLQELGFGVLDVGTNSTDAVDYPDFAIAVAKAVASGQARAGIMVDGAGIGSAMAANKIPGVRAALCYDITTANNAREHNNANVLTLGGTLIGQRLALDIAKTFLTTEFGGGRHAGRVAKIDALDR
jgi:ribose 5-phosphate isomerase B